MTNFVTAKDENSYVHTCFLLLTAGKAPEYYGASSRRRTHSMAHIYPIEKPL